MRFEREDIDRMWVQAVKALGQDKFPGEIWQREYDYFIVCMSSGKQPCIRLSSEEQFLRDFGVFIPNLPNRQNTQPANKSSLQNFINKPNFTQPPQLSRQKQTKQNTLPLKQQQQQQQQTAKTSWHQSLLQPLTLPLQLPKPHLQPLPQKQLDLWPPLPVPKSLDSKFNKPKPEPIATAASSDLAHNFAKPPIPSLPPLPPLPQKVNTTVSPKATVTSLAGKEILFSPVKHDIGDTSDFFNSLPPILTAIGKTVTKPNVPATGVASASNAPTDGQKSETDAKPSKNKKKKKH